MIPYYETKLGKLYHGDCLDIMPELEPVDLVLADPPYGIGVNKMTLGNGKHVLYRGEYNWDFKPADISMILSIECKKIIWGGNYFNVPPARCWLVWDKGTGKNDYADCELAWTNINSVVKKFFRSWVGKNAKEYEDSNRYHITQKSVELMIWCIELSKTDGCILDPYLGSGTTAIACERLNRKWIGIEIEEKYCEIAAKRIEENLTIMERIERSEKGITKKTGLLF